MVHFFYQMLLIKESFNDSLNANGSHKDKMIKDEGGRQGPYPKILGS